MGRTERYPLGINYHHHSIHYFGKFQGVDALVAYLLCQLFLTLGFLCIRGNRKQQIGMGGALRLEPSLILYNGYSRRLWWLL